ncbi:MAG: hypothetical protein ABIP94_14430 [Planctomycetota bacterium]
MLEEFLGRAVTAPIYNKGWVDVMVDVDRDTNGKEINERLKGNRSGGLPWMVVLDAEGKEIVSSNLNGDGSNIGGPRSEEECAWFVEMLRKTRGTKISEAEIAVVEADLETYAAPNRKPPPVKQPVKPPGK